MESPGRYFEGFSWAVPLAFADALSLCRFEQGDTMYDTPKAYEGTWGQALKELSHSIQVKYPPRTGVGVGVAKGVSEKELKFAENWKQKVVFELRDYKQGSTREVTTTQGRLYTVLWRGDLCVLDEQASALPPPKTAMHIRRTLAKHAPYFRSVFPEEKGSLAFFMPYDPCHSLLRGKLQNVKDVLREYFKVGVRFLAPEEIGLPDFAPTARVACFVVQSDSLSKVKELLKGALYKPGKGKKTTDDRFRLEDHGYLLVL